MSKQDKEQAGVLLEEIAQELRKDDGLLLRVSRGHWEDVMPIFLAKAREAVKGAGLTPQQVQDSYHSTPGLLERAKEYYGDTIEYFDTTQLACRWSVAEAQTQAILKALGG